MPIDTSILIVDPSFHDEFRAVRLPSCKSAEEWLVTISQVNRRVAQSAVRALTRNTPMHMRSESGEIVSMSFY